MSSIRARLDGGSPGPDAIQQPSLPRCETCDLAGSNLRRCAGCGKARYCSKECQTAGWRLHIFDCNRKKAIATAYYLSKACHENVVPLHERTREDYGFNKALELAGGHGEKMLLGLWTEVFVVYGVTEKGVQKWQSEGRLVEGVKSTFQQVPLSVRGPHYPWLLLNQNLLNGRPLNEAEKEGRIETYSDTLHRTWEFIGGPLSDLRQTIWSQISAMSPYEQRCFFFYESLVGNKDPTPDDVETWLSFGFTAMTREDVGELVEKYKQLMCRCTFHAFCVAYYTCTLPQLFSEHGIATPVATLPSKDGHDGPSPVTLFLDVMSQSPHLYKSVWLLKAHVDRLLRAAASGNPKIPHDVVEADYGYSNCRTAGEKKLLDVLYKKYFMHPDANPLDLHVACINGELGQYLARFVRMKPKTKTYMRLLKTAYPSSRLGDKAGIAGVKPSKPMLNMKAIVDQSGKVHLLDKDIDLSTYGYGEPKTAFLIKDKRVGNKLMQKGLAG